MSSNEQELEERPGVLLSDEIERYAKEFKMIDPFDPNNLRPASYDLTLGEEYTLGGKHYPPLDHNNKNLEIPPHEVAIVTTREKLNMPKNLIGRWNIRVHYVYKGLLWVGGPQVDPGFSGHLRCPLYNLSTRSVTLVYGETFATIDFVKTTPFKKGCKEYELRRPDTMSSYDDLTSKPKELAEKIDGVEKMIERLQDRTDRFQTVTFTVLGLIIATISIMTTVSYLKVELASFIPAVVLWIAIIALVIALVAIIRRN